MTKQPVPVRPALDYPTLGRHIRNLRKFHRLTQADLARATAISTSFMGHIERGTRVPSLETTARLAAALSVSIDALLTGLDLQAAPQPITYQARLLNDILLVLHKYAQEWLPR